MIAQVLIYKQRIESRCIKTGEKHTYHNNQIYLFALYTFGQITIIVLKLIAVNTITGFEHRIIVIDSFRQKLLGTAIHGRRLKCLIRYLTYRILLFVGSIRKDGRNFQRLFAPFLQVVQFLIIAFCSIYTIYRKHGIKALAASIVPVGLNTEILQDVLRYFLYTGRMEQCQFVFCSTQLLLIQLFFYILETRTDIIVINFELQYLFISDSISDNI